MAWIGGVIGLAGALINSSSQSDVGSAAQTTLQGSYMNPWTFAGAGGINAGLGVGSNSGVNPYANSNGWTNYNSLAGVGQAPGSQYYSPTGAGGPSSYSPNGGYPSTQNPTFAYGANGPQQSYGGSSSPATAGSGASGLPPGTYLGPGGSNPSNFSPMMGGQNIFGGNSSSTGQPVQSTGGTSNTLGSAGQPNATPNAVAPNWGATYNGGYVPYGTFGGEINNPITGQPAPGSGGPTGNNNSGYTNGMGFPGGPAGSPYGGQAGTAGFNLGQQNNAIFGGYQTIAGQSAGMAGQFLNGLPSYLNNAYGQASMMANPGMLPQGTQGGLYGLNSAYMGGLGGSAGMMGMGLQQAQNPLIGMAQGGAANLIGNAGTNFNNIYNSSLANLQQQLQIPQQQQLNATNNAEFERGQMGTTGGALQTQAMATGFGQADLAAQQQAFNQAITSQQTALSGAGTLGNLATGQQTSGMNMFGAGTTGMGNFGSLTANNLQNIYGQNQGLFSTAQNQAQTGLNNAFTYAGMPGQLAAQYLGVSGTGAQDMSGLFNMGMNAYGEAAGTSASEAAAANKVGLGLSGLLSNNNSFGTNSPWSAVGAGINNAGGFQGISNGLSNIFGSNSQSPSVSDATAYSPTSPYAASGGYISNSTPSSGGYTDVSGGTASDATSLDWLGAD
jgi:hypothetical protein